VVDTQKAIIKLINATIKLIFLRYLYLGPQSYDFIFIPANFLK
jgi:hypothetical protein